MKLKILPPVVLLFSFCMAYILYYFLPVIYLHLPYQQGVFIILAATGFLVIVLSAISFWRFKTTVHPHNPLETTTIVKSGLFRFSRNPMYLGMLFILVGFCYFLSVLTAFASVVFFVCYITAYQIKPEEEMLEQKFGQAYKDYKNTVRRWL